MEFKLKMKYFLISCIVLFVVMLYSAFTTYNSKILFFSTGPNHHSIMDLVNWLYYKTDNLTFLILFPIFLEEVLERRELYMESLVIRHRSFKDLYKREMRNHLIKTFVYMIVSVLAILISIKLMGESPNLINWNVKESFFECSEGFTSNSQIVTVVLFFTGITIVNFLVGFITKVDYFYNRSFYRGFLFCFIMFVLDVYDVNIFKALIFPVVGFSEKVALAILSQLVTVSLIVIFSKNYESKGKKRYLNNIMRLKGID
ncbi:MAG: hypothetical protein Q4E02_00235 [Lagierella massiliensis]|nr:hypothetical protein [Lagierella massiliensis]